MADESLTAPRDRAGHIDGGFFTEDPMPRRLPILPPALLCALLAACAARSSDPRADQLYERITRVDPAADGSATVEFESSQRRFRIDPLASPEAPAMIAFAQAAKGAGRAVHATIAPGAGRTKGDDGPPFVLIRLADTPSPPR